MKKVLNRGLNAVMYEIKTESCRTDNTQELRQVNISRLNLNISWPTNHIKPITCPHAAHVKSIEKQAQNITHIHLMTLL